MAFKSMKEYNEERFGGLFLLRNDGDYADVIFMYRNVDDVLVADTHYIKSSDYSGYVHCTGRGCPACNKGIRVQTKLFIPLYNINDQELQIFDRSIRFENQLNYDVFSKFPNPCEYVFRITRHGAAGDVNTTYAITAMGKNTFKSYNEILAECKTSFPDFYSNICKDYSAGVLNMMLNTPADHQEYESDMPSYAVTPRVTVAEITPAPVAVAPAVISTEVQPVVTPVTATPSYMTVLTPTVDPMESTASMEPIDDEEVNF